MSKYILLFHMPKGLVVPQSDRITIFNEMVAWERQLDEGGKSLTTLPLFPAEEALNFELENDLLVQFDGTSMESDEILVGASLIEVSSLQDAAAIARQCPHTKCGRVEVRQVRPSK
jgi:hypothetical protein